MIVESEEDRRIAGNLLTIRHYIKAKFPGYTMTEHSVPSLYHQFTVTNEKLHKSYTLKVNWSRLSDRRNTSERTRLSLNSGFVASGMVRAGDTFYSW
ncbi:hypothetical protein [Nitrospira sp. BLG_2]|uniref:hypothetical protein n=1 Tax=Nitrospira sp. BLG_2 TaxID=3397507 RepID=UPI003B9D9EAC